MNFKNTISKRLNIPTKSVFIKYQLESIDTLEVSNIHDTQGLQYCTNLAH